MNRQIRPARVQDVDAIFAIRTGVHENHMSLEQLAGLGITPPVLAAMLSAMTQDCPLVWVAQLDGEQVKGGIAGFSMIDQDEACLFAAFIQPRFEGQGLGRALVTQAEEALFRHHPHIWLETASASRACGFYRHLGWRITDELAGGDVRMEKSRPMVPLSTQGGQGA